MLSTGIKSPIGIKVSGTVLADLDHTAQQIEEVANTVPGVTSALAERLECGRYITVDIKREKAARYGMSILWGTGAGSEVMSRIAAPMVGGMITVPLLPLFIIPAAYKLIWLRRHKVNKS